MAVQPVMRVAPQVAMLEPHREQIATWLDQDHFMQLVVAADGRFSRVRSLAGLEPMRTPAAFDILWFRLPRRDTDPAPGIL